jgi:dCTP deaminase
MLLSEREIRQVIDDRELVIDPFDPNAGMIQPASIDLRLDNLIQLQRSEPIQGIIVDANLVDVTDHLDRYTNQVDISPGKPFDFLPGMFVIGKTLERVEFPTSLAGRVEGRSRLARLGVGVHITAPKIDPGFRNQITLEMFNIGPSTIRLEGGMAICTLLVERLGSPATWGYNGIFQGRTH